MKKILALVLTLLMIVGMTAALADNTYTIASPSNQNVVTGHTYKAYQIFTATSYNTTTKEYGNLAFSANVSAGAQTALLGSNVDAQALAATLGDNDSAAATAFAKAAFAQKAELGEGTAITSGTTVLPIGLYLIVDETTAKVDVINWANLFASDGTAPVTVVSKVDAPESDKQVKDKNDTTGDESDWQDSADYDVGDAVPFKLTATLPGNYTSYETYWLTFHDVMGAGLSFNAGSVEVYFGSTKLTADTHYTLAVPGVGDNDTFSIAMSDAQLKAIEGLTNNSIITVYYDATLTGANVVYGKAGNPNTSWITYDNNPNTDQDGEGETPHDTVIVFTYKTHIDKYDNKQQDLTGANFTLYKEVPQGTTNAVKGSDIKATFVAGVESSAMDDDKYYIEVGNKTGDATGSTFEFAGVDDGTYVLIETTIPDGYNAWASAVVEVEATHNPGPVDIDPATGKIEGTETYVLTELKDDNDTLTNVDAQLSTLSEGIINQSGNTLPSTGGMGTTILYIGGSILVLAAVILLVTKRRMKVED